MQTHTITVDTRIIIAGDLDESGFVDAHIEMQGLFWSVLMDIVARPRVYQGSELEEWIFSERAGQGAGPGQTQGHGVGRQH